MVAGVTNAEPTVRTASRETQDQGQPEGGEYVSLTALDNRGRGFYLLFFKPEPPDKQIDA